MRAVLMILALSLLGLSAEAARDIPFDFVDGYILLHASVNAHPVTLMLDSGASASVLSLQAARRLHLALGGAQPVDGVDANATAYDIGPVNATASGVALDEIGLAIDLRNAAQLCRERVDGLIGANFFRGRVTQIDYAHGWIRLLGNAPEQGVSLPLRARNGVFCLPVSVNGSRPRWTRLDTGCNDAVHWVVPRMAATDGPRGVSVGFITDTADETPVSVRLGRLMLPGVPAVLHGSAIFPGEAGLLGSEVLAQYLVTIDARTPQLGRILLASADR
ncbi:MAG: retropepsin-like aspartic protease [Chthoniobacteraceae bacterium]|jgi:hypothetical protein